MIELKNIDFSYHHYDEGLQKQVLKNLSLHVNKGEWLAVIGPNGSGKSTMVKTIIGILEIDGGEIFVDGELLTEETVWRIREKVGMVFQNPDNQFVGSTVEDDVAFGLENKGVPREEMLPRVQEALEMVGMWDLRHRQPESLSGGQKQRVAIAGVLALKPDVIILDESTSMLDPKARAEVLDTVREIKEKENLTVISITHDIDEAAEATRIVVLGKGQVKDDGTPEEIFIHGSELINMGLDVPFAEQLKDELHALGIEVPKEYMTEEEMEGWLLTFDSTM